MKGRENIMKKTILTAVTAASLLAGCGSTVSSSAASSAPSASAAAENETVELNLSDTLSIIAPMGAPAYSLVGVADSDQIDLTVTDGADALQAAFISPQQEYDVIIAPTNLGAKLEAAGKTDYELAAVVTTGNLYIVGTSEDVLSSDGTIALFGENAVPGLVYEKLAPTSTMTESWYNSVSEAQAALLAGEADAALLAEPAATAAIAKGKENGLELMKAADLQKLWGDSGYPMASLFVRKDTADNRIDDVKALIEAMDAYDKGVENGDIDVQADLEALPDPTLFGSTPAAMAAKTYEAMGINISEAANEKEEIQEFLDLFGVTLKEDAVISFD